MKLGRRATYGLLAGIAVGAYAWMQSTPKGKRTLHQLQRQLQGGRIPMLEAVPTGRQVQSLMGTVAEGTRDFLERGSHVMARQGEMAQPTLRDLGERAADAGQMARELGRRARQVVLPAAAVMIARRLRREQELDDILGERRRWRGIPSVSLGEILGERGRRRPAPAAVTWPTLAVTTATTAIGRFVLGLVQTIVRATLWLIAITAFLVLIYRPEQFRLDRLGQTLMRVFNTTAQAVGRLVDRVRDLMMGTRRPYRRPGEQQVV